MEPRFFKGIWLGRDTMTGESIIGIPGKIIRVRAIRRQIEPDKYDRQLLDTINVYPWNSPTPPTAISPQLLLPANPQASSYAIGTQTGIPMEETSTQTQQTGPQVTRGTTSSNGCSNGNFPVGNISNNNHTTSIANASTWQKATGRANG